MHVVLMRAVVGLLCCLGISMAQADVLRCRNDRTGEILFGDAARCPDGYTLQSRRPIVLAPPRPEPEKLYRRPLPDRTVVIVDGDSTYRLPRERALPRTDCEVLRGQRDALAYRLNNNLPIDNGLQRLRDVQASMHSNGCRAYAQ